MHYVVSLEARCSGVGAIGDLGDRLLTALEAQERTGRIAAPAVSEDLRERTVGVTVCVDGEVDPVRAADRARSAFLEALDCAEVHVVELVELRVTLQHEDAATVA